MLRIGCPYCVGRLKVPEDAVGQPRRCPFCYRTFTVRPAPREQPETRQANVYQPAEDSSTFGHDYARKYIVVECPCCGSRLYGTLDEGGSDIQCEDCGTPVRLPEALPPPTTTGVQPGSAEYARKVPAAEDEYQVAGDGWWQEDRLEQDRQRYVTVECGTCGTRLIAERSQIGQQIECPDCGRKSLIKPVEAGAAAYSARAPVAGTYEVHDDADVPQTEFRLLVNSERDQERFWLDRELGKPPRFLFFSGVWTFPFLQSTLTQAIWLLGVGIIAAFCGEFVRMTIHQLGLGSILTMLAMAIAVFFGAVFFVQAGAAGIATLIATSQGADDLASWSETVWLDRLVECFYLFNAAVAALILGMVIAAPAQWFDGPRAAIVIGTVIILFPLFLLSSMEKGSPFELVSPVVWKTLLRYPARWLQFHLLSAPLVLGVGWLIWNGLGLFGLFGDAIVDAVVIVYAWLVYTRLLGRLTWYVSQEEPTGAREATAATNRTEP